MKTLTTVFLSLLMFSHISLAEDNKFDMTFYGFVKFETFYDQTKVAQGDWLLFVPSNADQDANDVFSMNARHTRLGMKLDGPKAGKKGKINGLIELDFAGGFPNSGTAARHPLPRLRHAWVELIYPEIQLRIGQDWALIAGPFPNTTSFVVGAGKGNLWMRYPQIKFTVNPEPVKFAVSVNRPIAGNVKYDNFEGGSFDPVLDGEITGMPWFMGRVWLDADPVTFSVSGHYGREDISDLSGAIHEENSYSMNADAKVKIGKFELIARGFYGENLNSFFGGVFRGFINDSSSVTNLASKGGWAHVKYNFSDSWAATVGGGFDDPDNDDLTEGMRTKNEWLFGNVSYNIAKSVTFMLEGEYLKTSYMDKEAGDNLRLMFVTYYKF